MESLSKARKNVIEFSGITANPTYAKVLRAKVAREHKVISFLPSAAAASWIAAKPFLWQRFMTAIFGLTFWARPGIIQFDPLPWVSLSPWLELAAK